MDPIIICVIALSVIVVVLVVVIFARLGKKPDGTGQLNDISRRMDNLTKMMNENALRSNESVHKQLAASQKLVADITEKMKQFEGTNKNILQATDKLEDLQNILLNPKHRGNFGEFQLGSLLDNYFPPNQWKKQYKFKNGEVVDAVIFLKDDKVLPIDAKFPLENYRRMLNAKQPDTKNKYLKDLQKDLKNRIDETSKYVRPSENTMDFAFMFLPSEAIYYDMFLGNIGSDGSGRNLLDYAMREKHVVVVSPTTFVAYLNTVLQGLHSLQIEEQAKDIQKNVQKLGRHITKFNDYMVKVGNSLKTTVSHYNTAHKELGKIDKDVVKIAGGKESIEPLLLDKPSEDEQ